jgi:hypothetical protein
MRDRELCRHADAAVGIAPLRPELFPRSEGHSFLRRSVGEQWLSVSARALI